MSDQSQWIIETTTERFEADVIERSAQLPVVVDFWAPWCEPCRQLGPVLEKLAVEYNGKFLLVKVDVEANQEIAAACRVESIPYVLAFHDRQGINQFVGLMPEAELREWIGTILPSEVDALIKQGQELEQTDAAAATDIFQKALELSPQDDAIKIHLARSLAAQNRGDECRAIIAELEQRGFLEPEGEAIKAQIELREAAAEAGGVVEARKAAEAAPDDLPAQLALADTLAVAGQHSESLDICLALIERDKGGIGGDAKDTMVKIFEMPGTPPHLISEYRRKLATAWY
ncbi:MAG: tetratricopeptide repeat protein [Planctomycetaceae bacterium]|jgi:putative thioredoxin|nr:tetratricopeptide repeat protein [Planctomycetaceae bacterium]MBT6158285.1 tetratricopeptide repeat protein [Planctomycetaceae bacterium]MBT6487360.1 tetratricopeptide repeat protein [Planctomycetaceae bacterium]MBT6494416.1 tetratricopeptide repeat protein [Planctomycetaceae bacterium]